MNILLPNLFTVTKLEARKVILISLSVHILLAAIFLFRLSPVRTAAMTSGPHYSVNLVGTPMNIPEVAINDSTRKSLTKIDPSTLSAMNNVFAKSSATANKDKVLEELKKRLAQGQTSGGEKMAGKEQVNGLLATYYGQVERLIKQQWGLPQGVSSRSNIETIVTIRIRNDGVLTYAAFEKSSGNRYLDESAMRAVKRVSRFPVFPEWLKGSDLEIGVKFNPSELR